MKYLWITDATPGEVEAKTGLRGVPTPYGGTLVEDRPLPDIGRMMDELRRVTQPPRKCFCAVVHMPPCPFAYIIT